MAKSYDITEQQAILFSICMEEGPKRVNYIDLARHLDISKIKILSYATDIDALVRRRQKYVKILNFLHKSTILYRMTIKNKNA